MELHGAVAIIVIDNPPVNAASTKVRRELMNAVELLESDPAMSAGVIRCEGRTFMVGADVREFSRPPEEPRLGVLFDRIEACKKPLVVALHGTVLGGGLELAMACHGRVAAEGTSLGLPEVKLGLIPGAGGTQRLPRLVGVRRALELAATGEAIDAKTALEWGLVDEVVSSELLASALSLAKHMLSEDTVRRTGDMNVALPRPSDSESAALDAEFTRRARGVRAVSRVVTATLAAAELSLKDGLKLEASLFQECRNDEQSAALRYLFFAERSVGKTQADPVAIRRTAVIGSGTMGVGIAIALADAGINVRLIDADSGALERGMTKIESYYAGRARRGRITVQQANDRRAAIQPALEVASAADCDLAIEAVFESMSVKKQVFAKLQDALSPDALLATNTSYLDVDLIASAVRQPDRVLGLHFFSPAQVMRLVEVVRACATSERAVATGVALARRLKKVPVVVANSTGFVGNRMLQAYGRESQLMLLEGATPWQIDDALESWGMAMGPNAVLDLAGLDIGYRARRERTDLPDDPRYFRIADALVEAGRVGRKCGRGSYLYSESGQRLPDSQVEKLIAGEAARFGIERRSFGNDEIVERCVLALVNEGLALLQEGVASSASDIDVVWANGYGFPRHRGGPMWFAEQQGWAAVYERISQLKQVHGSLYWTPAGLLKELADSADKPNSGLYGAKAPC